MLPSQAPSSQPPGSSHLHSWERGARRRLSPAFQQLGFLAPFATTHIVLSALAFSTVATQPAICTPTAAEEQHIHTYRMGMCRNADNL